MSSLSTETGWQRLHPLSPVVRGGRLTITLAILLLPTAFGGARSLADALPQVGVAIVVLAAGFVSWLVTRWRIDGGDVQIESGLLRRRSVRYPLAQVQAIDTIRPGLARAFGMSELRLRMAGAGASGRLAYLREDEAETVRAQLLQLAGAAAGPRRAASEARETADGAPQQGVELARTDTGRLIVSTLISGPGLVGGIVLATLIVAYIRWPHAALAAVEGGGTIYVLGFFVGIWRRFNQLYGLTVSRSPDGLHLNGGLVAVTAEVIRPGRVQAVRIVEPVLWRPLRWCRLEVDVAGKQRRKGESQAERGQLRTLLPVGDRAVALSLLDVLLPGRPNRLAPPPERARWKSPLRYRNLAWGRTDSCVATTGGRFRRVSSWVPLEKVQSFRYVQGPVQRRLGLATVHLDTAGRGIRASLRDRDAHEATDALTSLTAMARVARNLAVRGSPSP